MNGAKGPNWSWIKSIRFFFGIFLNILPFLMKIDPFMMRNLIKNLLKLEKVKRKVAFAT